MHRQPIHPTRYVKIFAAALLAFCLYTPAQSFAEQTLYPAPNPMPNGAYIMCHSGNLGNCYDLRDAFNNTNTQLEHVADRLLLRSDNTGFLQNAEAVIPLTWQAPDKDRVIVNLQNGETWQFTPQGAFLESETATFIFIRSEREYEDSEGGEITIP